MKLIVSDASSLILLNKIKLIERLSKLMSIKIPLEVKKEAVDIGKENNYQDAFEIEKLISKNLNIKNSAPPKIKKINISALNLTMKAPTSLKMYRRLIIN